MNRVAVAILWLTVSAAVLFTASALVNSFLPRRIFGVGEELMCFLIDPSAGFYGCAGAFAGLGLGLLIPLFIAETQRDLRRMALLGLVLLLVGGPASSVRWLGPFVAFLGAGLSITSFLGLLM